MPWWKLWVTIPLIVHVVVMYNVMQALYLVLDDSFMSCIPISCRYQEQLQVTIKGLLQLIEKAGWCWEMMIFQWIAHGKPQEACVFLVAVIWGKVANYMPQAVSVTALVSMVSSHSRVQRCSWTERKPSTVFFMMLFTITILRMYQTRHWKITAV